MTSTLVTVAAVPTPPTGFTVPSTGTVGNVTLSWTPVAGATRYMVGVTQLNSFHLGTWTYYPATDPSFNLPLTAGQYDFTLSACNSVACSLQVTGGPLHLTDPTGAEIRVRALMKAAAHLSGMDNDAGGGCSATSCAATVGAQP